MLHEWADPCSNNYRQHWSLFLDWERIRPKLFYTDTHCAANIFHNTWREICYVTFREGAVKCNAFSEAQAQCLTSKFSSSSLPSEIHIFPSLDVGSSISSVVLMIVRRIPHDMKTENYLKTNLHLYREAKLNFSLWVRKRGWKWEINHEHELALYALAGQSSTNGFIILRQNACTGSGPRSQRKSHISYNSAVVCAGNS